MIRVLLVLFLATTGAALVYGGDPGKLTRAGNTVTALIQQQIPAVPVPRTQQIARTGGEFRLNARINGVTLPMVIDTGATSVVLTYEAAKAAGLPLELLDYNVPVETVGGSTRAARLTLDSLAVGNVVEHAIPALVVPRGQMKTSLLGMSFLDRLESWEVRADHLMLRGYP